MFVEEIEAAPVDTVERPSIKKDYRKLLTWIAIVFVSGNLVAGMIMYYRHRRMQVYDYRKIEKELSDLLKEK